MMTHSLCRGGVGWGGGIGGGSRGVSEDGARRHRGPSAQIQLGQVQNILSVCLQRSCTACWELRAYLHINMLPTSHSGKPATVISQLKAPVSLKVTAPPKSHIATRGLSLKRPYRRPAANRIAGSFPDTCVPRRLPRTTRI